MVVRILGIEQLLAKFKRIGEVDMAPPIRDATLRVQRSAKDLAPKDTGWLQDSIKREALGRSYADGGTVYTTTTYAPYQEYGTHDMVAANGGIGFMRPAFDINEAINLREIEKYINDQLK
jgi:HK97 gp10 family phage protein